MVCTSEKIKINKMIKHGTTDNSAGLSQELLKIVQSAKEDGTLEQVTKHWNVDHEKIGELLGDFETQEEQVEYLQAELTCFYFMMSEGKDESTEAFLEESKSFDEDPEFMTLFIHGYLLQYLK